MKLIEINIEIIEALYINNGMTAQEIGDILGVAKSTILSRMRRYGIPKRSSNDQRKTEISKEKLIELYINQGMTSKKISILYGVSEETIRRKLVSYGIPRRPTSETAKGRVFSENSRYIIGMRQLGKRNHRYKHGCSQTPEYNRDFRHRRRAQIYGIPIQEFVTKEQWEHIISSQKGKCAMCGAKFSDNKPATKDHIVPLSKGGIHRSDNIQALCKSCNGHKHSKIDLSKIQSWIFTHSE